MHILLSAAALVGCSSWVALWVVGHVALVGASTHIMLLSTGALSAGSSLQSLFQSPLVSTWHHARSPAIISAGEQQLSLISSYTLWNSEIEDQHNLTQGK